MRIMDDNLAEPTAGEDLPFLRVQSHEVTTITAFRRILSDLGSEPHLLTRVREEKRHRSHRMVLTDGQVESLQLFSTTSFQAYLRSLPAALMMTACSSIVPDPTRLALANMAVGLCCQISFALRPGDLASLGIVDREFQFPQRVRQPASPRLNSEELNLLLATRVMLRVKLEAAETRFLFPGARQEPMSVAALDMSLKRILDLHQLPHIRWQDLRDLAAVLVLKNPRVSRPVKSVADLRDSKDIRLVRRPYQPFLPTTC